MHEHLRRPNGPVGQRAPASPPGEGGPVVSLIVTGREARSARDYLLS
jgi:hypothetical protein